MTPIDEKLMRQHYGEGHPIVLLSCPSCQLERKLRQAAYRRAYEVVCNGFKDVTAPDGSKICEVT